VAAGVSPAGGREGLPNPETGRARVWHAVVIDKLKVQPAICTKWPVDLIYPIADDIIAIEAKAGETVSRQFFTGFKKLRMLLGARVRGEILVHGSEEQYEHGSSQVTGPSGFVPVLSDLEEAVTVSG
jgi:hypothetical protein